MFNRLRQRHYRGISLIELILVLVAIGFLTLGGIQFIAARVEKDKVQRAAGQIEGWLLAAQAYYRDHVHIQIRENFLLWPTQMSQMYPYIASDTVKDKFGNDPENNPSIDPWGNAYTPEPYQSYLPPKEWNSALTQNGDIKMSMPPNPTRKELAFFTLQVPVAKLPRALAIIAQLPNARLATDNEGNLIRKNGNVFVNAFIPPPAELKSAVGHQLIMNMGVVKTKLNDQAKDHNYYNYTIDEYSFDSIYNQRFLKPEYSHGKPLHSEDIRHYGAVFIAQPKCPGNTQPYIQASVAGFGITEGYSSKYNTNSDNSTIASDIPAIATLQSTTPVPYNKGTVPYDNSSNNRKYASYFMMSNKPNDKNFYLGSNSFDKKGNLDKVNTDTNSDNGAFALEKAIGGIIGVHVKSSPAQDFIDNKGQLHHDIQGWYLWLDITANMAVYPNILTSDVPQVIQDCAMNINTRITGDAYDDSNQFPYDDDSGLLDDSTHTSYKFISKPPIYTNDSKQAMIATDLIARSAAPLYRPSPCHFHSGYIAYMTSCAPVELAQANGLDKAQEKLTSW